MDDVDSLVGMGNAGGMGVRWVVDVVVVVVDEVRTPSTELAVLDLVGVDGETVAAVAAAQD